MTELKPFTNEASQEALNGNGPHHNLADPSSADNTHNPYMPSTDNPQAHNPPATLKPIPPEGLPLTFPLFSHTVLLWTAISTLLIYIVLWIVYGTSHSTLWMDSLNAARSLSQHGGFLHGYSWTFSEIFYKWYMTIIPLLLLFAPRKDSALTSIVAFVLSYAVRQYIRLCVAETRPYYDDEGIVLRLNCDCSYGMPSGHSEGTAMLYSLLFYELFVHNSESRARRLSLAAAWVFITGSVMFSRVYFGRHSLPQVVLGAWQGLTVFMLIILFQKPLNRLSLGFLNGDRQIIKWVALTSWIIPVLSVILWYSVWENQIKTNTLPHKRCFECWNNEAAKIRNDLGPALMLPWILPGLLFGLAKSGSSWQTYNPDLFRLHWSLQGLKKFLIFAVCYAPLLLVIGISYPVDIKVPVSIGIYMLTGILTGWVPIYLFHKWKLNFPGDLTILNK